MSAEQLAQIQTARAAVIAQIASGAALVEYEIGGRRVKRDPKLAIEALNAAEEALIRSASPMADRRSIAGRRR